MTKLTVAVLLSTLSCVTAFPAVAEMGALLQKRVEPAPRAPLGKLNRPNTGLPPSGFNAADQFVDVTDEGRHRYITPQAGDIRGQCPGLNAAANHGFINRNGLTTITQAIQGLGAAYNMGPDFAAFLVFSVTGTPGNFVHNSGLERIPLNWYRRPTADAHTIPAVLVDLFLSNSIFPGIIRLGGNTGTTNSFVGIEVGDFTAGAYNLDTLAEGNNAACFLLQASLSGLPDAAASALGALGSVLGWATSRLGPIGQNLGCPQLKSFNNDLFNAFPGASYTGSGQ